MRLQAAVLLIALLASPGWAQPADPIGELLDRQQEEPAPVEDDEEPEVPTAPEIQPSLAVPVEPPRPRPQLTAPVHIDETGKSPDAPPTTRDLAYESRVRSSFASAQGFQGPLDGGWTLSGPGGDLYSFRLVDKGRGSVEGAWLDLRRKGAPAGSGFIDQVERVGDEMILRFAEGAVAELTGGSDGRWSGRLTEKGEARAVTLRRTP
ncbi:hypothetical protein [Phenylobacterium sp.]|jgi:hypothetical protein|uniref:hypothetical protein n=1 Tax=Phenylobacterium sp. TaxID=1871053 RepID=UPI002F9350A1